MARRVARRSGSPEASEFSAVLLSLVALIEAGASQRRAWRALATRFPSAPVVRTVASGELSPPWLGILAAVGGVGVGAARFGRGRLGEEEGRAWREIAAVLLVAQRCGAPLSEVLRDCAAQAIRRLEESRRVGRSIAGAAATGRMLTATPVLGLLLAQGVGFDPIGAVRGSVFASAAVIGAAGFAVISMLWRRALLRRATVRDSGSSILLRLAALAVHSGASTAVAREWALRATARCGIDAPDPAGGGRDVGARPPAREPEGAAAIEEVVRLARALGAPVGRLLVGEADRRESATHARALSAAQALETSQLLPLGLCDLPAFFLAGVVPVVVSMLGAA